MEKEFVYPSVDKVIEFNILSLNAIKAKRADKAKTLSVGAIEASIRAAKEGSGDITIKLQFL